MVEDTILVQLKEIGMSGYEAKVYLALISMNSASPRELHEATEIPRGRVYETLTVLEKKGFIVSNMQSPVRYRIADIPQTIERLKHEVIARYDILGITLQASAAPIEPDLLTRTYTIQTEWGVKNHIRLLLKTTKNELIIFSDDPHFYERYIDELTLSAKRIKINSVVSDARSAKKIPFPSYLADRDTKELLFDIPIMKKTGIMTKAIIYSDRKEVLAVYEREGKEEALFMKNSIYTDFIARAVMKTQMNIPA
ncbi:MAG TPA: hypothetical protein O0W87_01695 [Methanocorpusculum sp.]|nr:hypothetical protein [Methanocorpusculum sp.]